METAMSDERKVDVSAEAERFLWRRGKVLGGEAMKMSELILAVGDENVIFQNLLNDAQSIDKTKHGTKITFYTGAIQAEELMGGGKPDKMGLVLWLPRVKVEAAIASEKAGKP